jgi:hypothetical protein
MYSMELIISAHDGKVLKDAFGGVGRWSGYY